MSPQRRTALVSVLAACALIGLKLAGGFATGSLGLLSEAAHSGTALVAALLTFFAVGVAGRPADTGHHFGHGKAEHLAALGEGAILVLVSLVIAWRAVLRLTGHASPHVDATWVAFLVIGIVIVVDVSRTIVSARAARRYESAALASNALHFGSDLAGSFAVLGGLVFVHYGYPKADAIAALFVAVLVLVAATRLMRRNVDVLMDRVPAAAEEAARRAIADIEPTVDLRRLRMRSAAGRHFADVVIGVSPAGAVGHGHAAAGGGEGAPRGRPPSARDTLRPTRSKRPCSARCRRATSSCTSSRTVTRPRSASARTRLRSACGACARCTTSASSPSTREPSSRST